MKIKSGKSKQKLIQKSRLILQELHVQDNPVQEMK